jgi:glutathione S-transferase
MKLYYNPLSTYSQKVMIAFNEKGIAYTPEVVNLMSPEARAAYEQINALGKVPFLVADDGRPVPESTIIIEFLEDRFPNTPRLIPAGDSEAARQVRFIDRLADLYYNDQVVELQFQHLGMRAKDQDRAARARKYIDHSYARWTERLAKQPWLCGEKFSMADCAVIPVMFYAQTVAPFSDYANVVAYWERAQQRPCYAKVKAEFEPIWQGMLAQMKGA